MLQVLRRHFQARFDYLSFLATREALYVLTVVGTVFSLVALAAPKTMAAIVGALSLVIGLVGMVWDTVNRRREWAGYTFRRVVSPVNFSLSAPSAYGDSQALRGPHGGSMLISKEVGVELREADIHVTWDPEWFELPRELRATAPRVLSRRRRGGALLFNGPLVRLETDVTPNLLRNGGNVFLRPARFFDGECSNDLFAGWRIDSPEVGPARDLVKEYLADSAGRLVPLASSKLANAVGVSTLALTTDRHLIVVLQSARSAASKELWAPSGSGSLEPRDWKACPRPADPSGSVLLRDVVAQGMQRELREECELPAEAIGKTTVIGFARWVDRGGKPEFFGVTQLHLSSRELRRRPGGEEKLWTQRIRSFPLGESAWSEDRPDAVVAALAPVPDIYESMSLPLFVGLCQLARAVSTYPQLLDG